MKLALIIGGPLILAIAFAVWSGILVFGKIDGLEHRAGTEPGGTFETEEQSGGFSDMSGLEIEQEPIEYREGSEPTHVRKLNGLTKYANVTLRWPTGFDTGNWKFIFDESKLPKEEPKTKFSPKLYENPDAGVEMIEIDPPTLVIPAR